MRVLVTGGAGFIGVNLVHALSASHIPVVTLDALTYAAASESVRLLQAFAESRFGLGIDLRSRRRDGGLGTVSAHGGNQSCCSDACGSIDR